MTDITAGLIMLSEQEEEGEEEYLKRHPSVNLFELCCAVPRCDTNHQKLVLWSLLEEKEKERVMIAIIAIFCLFILEELSLEGIVDHPGAIKGKKFKQAWLLFFHTISHITIQLNHWASLEFFFSFFREWVCDQSSTSDAYLLQCVLLPLVVHHQHCYAGSKGNLNFCLVGYILDKDVTMSFL